MVAAISLCSDAGQLRAMARELPLPDWLYAHCEIERELIVRLESVQQEECGVLQSKIYTKLFTRLPDHLQHKADCSAIFYTFPVKLLPFFLFAAFQIQPALMQENTNV